MQLWISKGPFIKISYAVSILWRRFLDFSCRILQLTLYSNNSFWSTKEYISPVQVLLKMTIAQQNLLLERVCQQEENFIRIQIKKKTTKNCWTVLPVISAKQLELQAKVMIDTDWYVNVNSTTIITTKVTFSLKSIFIHKHSRYM